MIKGEKSQSTFKLNDFVKVTIKSTKKADRVFNTKIVIEHESVTLEPPIIESKKHLTELIQGLDFEDPQADLFDENQMTIDGWKGRK